MADPSIRLPRSYRRGDIIEVRTFIPHPMETGRRKSPASGKVVPEDIVRSFRARFDGVEIFHAELSTGISANPFIAFPMRADGPGELVCVWDNGRGQSWTAQVAVAPS